MTLYDPPVQSGLLALAGLVGGIASAANYTHAVSARSPAEPRDAKVRHFFALLYFAGIMLMGAAGLIGHPAPVPSPALVWLTICGAGWACTHAAKLGRQYIGGRRYRREPELPLWSRRRALMFWIVSAGSMVLPLVASSLPGCAVNPSYTAEQKAIVLEERGLVMSYGVVADLLTYDNENRAFLRAKFPAVHSFCEYLRETVRTVNGEEVSRFEAADRAAWAAHDLLKAHPTAANQAEFDVRAAQVAAWARQAREYLDKAR